jgi:hypothetical protein
MALGGIIPSVIPPIFQDLDQHHFSFKATTGKLTKDTKNGKTSRYLRESKYR